MAEAKLTVTLVEEGGASTGGERPVPASPPADSAASTTPPEPADKPDIPSTASDESVKEKDRISASTKEILEKARSHEKFVPGTGKPLVDGYEPPAPKKKQEEASEESTAESRSDRGNEGYRTKSGSSYSLLSLISSLSPLVGSLIGEFRRLVTASSDAVDAFASVKSEYMRVNSAEGDRIRSIMAKAIPSRDPEKPSPSSPSPVKVPSASGVYETAKAAKEAMSKASTSPTGAAAAAGAATGSSSSGAGAAATGAAATGAAASSTGTAATGAAAAGAGVGGILASASALATGFAALAAATAAAVAAMKSIVDYYDSLAQSRSMSYSGEVQSALAERDYRRLQTDIDKSRELGPQLAEYIRIRTETEAKWSKLATRWEAMGMGLASKLADFFDDFADVAEDITSVVELIGEAIGIMRRGEEQEIPDKLDDVAGLIDKFLNPRQDPNAVAAPKKNRKKKQQWWNGNWARGAVAAFAPPLDVAIDALNVNGGRK
jgi:hypothetical protein